MSSPSPVVLLTATEALRAAAPRVVRERLFEGAALVETVGTEELEVASDLRFAPRRVVTPASVAVVVVAADACFFASSRLVSSWWA